jgi:hypothetical protein
MAKTQYTSLGQMIKKGDFTKLLEELSEAQKDEKYLKGLLDNSNGPSELEGLLYFIPQYSLDENKKLRENTIECVDKIIDLGAYPNTVFKSGITPFMQACQYANKEYVEHFYIKAKPDCNLGDGRGARPLYYAMMGENIEVLDYLVKDLGANLDYKMILLDGKTVFHSACMELKEKSILKLMELGARPDIYDDNENYPCQLIPSFDDEIYDESEKDEEYYEKCDKLFTILKAHLKEYKENKKTKKLNI